MSKKNICYYCIATNLGGAEKSLLDLLSGLRQYSNFSPLVLLPQHSGAIHSELEKIGIPYEVLEMPPQVLKISRSTPFRSALNAVMGLPSFFLYLFRVRRFFLSKDMNIIHTTGIKCHLLVVFLTAATNIQVVWHLRDIFSYGPVKLLMLSMQFFGQKRISIIANSKATAISLSKSLSCKIVYNGIDRNFNSQTPNLAWLKEMNIGNSIPVVGMIGVLARWKGQLEFIKMVKILQDRGVRASFVIVGDQIYDTMGDDGYRLELEDLVRELGLSKIIQFIGFQKDIVNVLNGLSVLVHASIRPEPFGRVIIEAQACEIPVVASAAGGVLEIIENEKNGLLYEAGNSSAMADCVQRLLGNASFRKEIALAGRKKVEERFTLKSHVDSIIEVYQRTE